MINCDNCGKDYSEGYNYCPFCGYRNEKRSFKTIKGIIYVIF